MKTLREVWDSLSPEEQWEEYLRVVVNLEEYIGIGMRNPYSSLTEIMNTDKDKDQLILFEESLQLNDSGNQPS